MKRSITFFNLIVLINLCIVSYAQVPYHITGKWDKGIGKQVILHQYKDGEVENNPIDSATVAADGHFSFKGNAPRTSYGAIFVKGATKASHGVFFDGSSVDVCIYDTVETFLKHKRPETVITLVKGNKEQQGAEAMFQYYIASFTNDFSEGLVKLNLEKATDPHEIDSLKQVIRQKEYSMDSLLADYKIRYADCNVAPFFMELNMFRPCTTEQIDDFYNHLSTAVRNSAKGKFVGKHLISLKKLGNGASAPDLTLQTPDGKTLSLKDLRGKIVLIDFWASWCGPCMGEMPNVKNLYAKYHERGLEVLGVSMDNKKEAWVKSIEKEQLPWLQVSSLLGMGRCPVGKSYEVLAIPKFYIIDREGKIIAKDLRGEDLAQKVSSLFE